MTALLFLMFVAGGFYIIDLLMSYGLTDRFISSECILWPNTLIYRRRRRQREWINKQAIEQCYERAENFALARLREEAQMQKQRLINQRIIPMSKQTVFLVKALTESGHPEIRAPRPGEYFITEKTGKVVKRTSPTQPNMLRKIVEKHQVHPHFGLSDGAVLERSGGPAPVFQGDMFVGSNGKIGRSGHAKWKADGPRPKLAVIKGSLGPGTRTNPMTMTEWKAKTGANGMSDHAVAALYARYVSLCTDQ